VVLKLTPAHDSTNAKVQGIVHLVANAVKGLDEEHITILSTDGQVIFKKTAQESALQITGSQLELKNHLEENLRQKIQSMLESVVGPNRVIARVTRMWISIRSAPNRTRTIPTPLRFGASSAASRTLKEANQHPKGIRTYHQH